MAGSTLATRAISARRGQPWLVVVTADEQPFGRAVESDHPAGLAEAAIQEKRRALMTAGTPGRRAGCGLVQRQATTPE
jgi:hypothetical protein